MFYHFRGKDFEHEILVYTALMTAIIAVMGFIPAIPLPFIPVPIVLQNVGIFWQVFC